MERHPKSAGTSPRADFTRTNFKITDRQVRAIKSPPSGSKVFYDCGLRGFGVRAYASGRRSFTLNYYFKGRERRIVIGSYPEWSVVAARLEAESLIVEIAKGKDPLEKRDNERAAPTVRDMFERYRTDYLPKLASRSRDDQRNMFEKSILPMLGAKKVADVTFSDCEKLHRKLTKDRPIRANRVIEVLRRNFNLAIRWGWVDRNPASGIERNPEEKRERYLSPKEIEALLSALDEHKEVTSCDAIRFILLTGCRRGEALNARWDQFDEALRIWTKPAATTKQRKLHRVPVSSPVTDLLQRRLENATSPFVFDAGSGAPLTDIKRTWVAVTKVAHIIDARIHDLRHTFASVAVSQGASLPIIGAMLGHSQPQTTARYAHLFDSTLSVAVEAISEAMRKK